MSLRNTVRALATLSAVLMVCGGCGDDETTGSGSGGGGGSGSGGLTEADVVSAYESYLSSGYTQVSLMAEQSQHGLAPGGVVVWVQDSFESTYRAIDPAGTAGPFDAGTIVIKQQFDTSGADGSALIMAKFEAGYAPDTGDWFWARFEPNGDLSFSGAGSSVQFCIDCHQGNGFDQSHDWLAGLPDENK